MIPDERTCQYFITIAREKNISRAARSLYISQPTLSRFLTGLEKELGTPLFIRNNGILSPTPAGELFFQYITGLKGMESRFSNDLSSLLLPQKQTLRIGAGSITSPFLPEKVFPILHREYPDVELSLTEDIHVHLLSRMEKGELDLSVLVASGADTLFQPLCQSPCPCPKIVHNFPVPSPGQPCRVSRRKLHQKSPEIFSSSSGKPDPGLRCSRSENM